MSDAYFLQKLLKEISELKAKVDRLIDSTNPPRSYNLQQFAQAVGISKYKLKNWYKRDQLPIPAPYRVEGKDPIYTSDHVELLRTMLNEHR